MGTFTDAALFYGVEYSYDQVKHIKDLEEIVEMATDIDSDYLPDLWAELGFQTASYEYDCGEEYYLYIIGKPIVDDLTLDEFISFIDKEEVIDDIKNACKKFKLKYEEPKVICRPHIS